MVSVQQRMINAIVAIGVLALLATMIARPQYRVGEIGHASSMNNSMSKLSAFTSLFFVEVFVKTPPGGYTIYEDGSSILYNQTGEIGSGCLVPEWGCDHAIGNVTSPFHQRMHQAMFGPTAYQNAVVMYADGYAIAYRLDDEQLVAGGCLVTELGCSIQQELYNGGEQ